MAIFQESSFTLTGVDEPERIGGIVTSTELLSVLGVTPVSGRGFRAEDGRPGADKVVLITGRDRIRSASGSSWATLPRSSRG